MKNSQSQTSLQYYPAGTLKSYVTLVEDVVQVGGHLVKVSEGSEITFYRNGEVESLVLAEDTRFRVGEFTKTFSGNKRIEFLEEGVLCPSNKEKEDHMGILEQMFYEARPFIYMLLGFFSVGRHDNKVMVACGMVLLICGTIVFFMRIDYREKMARANKTAGS